MDNQLLLSLAETIQEEAKSITGYLKTQHGTPQASQPMDLPHELPKSVHESRQRLRGAAKELYDITFGAYDHLMNLAWDVSDLDRKKSHTILTSAVSQRLFPPLDPPLQTSPGHCLRQQCCLR